MVLVVRHRHAEVARRAVPSSSRSLAATLLKSDSLAATPSGSLRSGCGARRAWMGRARAPTTEGRAGTLDTTS